MTAKGGQLPRRSGAVDPRADWGPT